MCIFCLFFYWFGPSPSKWKKKQLQFQSIWCQTLFTCSYQHQDRELFAFITFFYPLRKSAINKTRSKHWPRGRRGIYKSKYWSSPCHLFSVLCSCAIISAGYFSLWEGGENCVLAHHAVSLLFGWRQSIVGCCFSVEQHGCTSVLQVVLADPLSWQLRQNVVQVIGVRVTVAGQVGAKFCLVVNLVPHNCVRLPCSAGCADGED